MRKFAELAFKKVIPQSWVVGMRNSASWDPESRDTDAQPRVPTQAFPPGTEPLLRRSILLSRPKAAAMGQWQALLLMNRENKTRLPGKTSC